MFAFLAAICVPGTAVCHQQMYDFHSRVMCEQRRREIIYLHPRAQVSKCLRVDKD